MIIKIFGEKQIKIKKFEKSDLKRAKEFQRFINSLIEEDAKILLNKKLSLEEERKWLKGELEKIKSRKKVFLIAESNNLIVGTSSIGLETNRRSHIGNFGIAIKRGYRRMGLGSYLTKEIIKLAKKELKPKPKIIRLSVYTNNKPAISLYEKFGFKKVAKVPKQIQYKNRLIDEIIMLLYL